MALAQPRVYPSISDLAEPMLRLAGVRINPRTNAERSYIYYWTSLILKRISDGTEFPVSLPGGVRRVDSIQWNTPGTMLALTNEAADGVELWIVEAATQKVRPVS